MAFTQEAAFSEPESYSDSHDGPDVDAHLVKAEHHRPSLLATASGLSADSLDASPPSLIHIGPTSGMGTNTSTPASGAKIPTTRRRVVQSCSECRRRKIKCDRKFPCGPCILRGDQPRCHEVDMNERRPTSTSGPSTSGGAHGSTSFTTAGGAAEKMLVHASSSSGRGYVTNADHNSLVHRVDALQHALIKAGVVVSRDIDDYLKSVRASAVSHRSHAHSADYDEAHLGSGTPGDSTPPDEAETAALTLEHLAFGRSQVQGSHAIPTFSAAPGNIARPDPESNYHLRRSTIGPGHEMRLPADPLVGAHSTSAAGGMGGIVDQSYKGDAAGAGSSTSDLLLTLLNPGDILDVFYKRTDLINKTLAKLLPTPEIGRIVIKNYLDKVLWLHRCLHVPTFLRQCNDLWAMPPERATEEFTLGFLGIYFVACCLGLQFMDPKEAAEVFSAEDIRTLPDAWYNASRTACWASDFFGRHTVESIQCLIIMTVFMNNQDRADAAWAFLGGAIKMAQGLGLSRLGAEPTASDGKKLPMWTGRWESLVEREVGRRVWWNLVFLDWTLAPSYNYATSIQPDQIKTAKPANIDDEDLSDSIPFHPKPSDVPTIMSYSLARIALAEVSHRQIWQANNNAHPPYAFILSLDADMHRALRDVPAYLRLDVAKRDAHVTGDEEGGGDKAVEIRKLYEKMGLHLAFHGRMLRLHRPFSSRGYTDEKYAYSKEQCIRAARAALRLMSADDGSASYLEKWWIALFYVSISGMVVIVDLIRTPKNNFGSTETNEKVAEVKGALDQMRRVTVGNARATLRIMDFLLAGFEERRSKILSQPRGTKRKSSSAVADGEAHDVHAGRGEERDSAERDEDGAAGDETLKKAVQELIKQAALEAVESDSAPSSTPGTDAKSPYAITHERRASETAGAHASVAGGVTTSSLSPMGRTTAQGPTAPFNPAMNNPYTGQMMQMGGMNPTNTFVNNAAWGYQSVPSTMQASFLNGGPVFPPPQTPALDPAVEGILANFFSNNAGASGPANVGPSTGMATGPIPTSNAQLAQQQADDFLLKVFSFSWDTQPQVGSGSGSVSMAGGHTHDSGSTGTGPGSAAITPVSGMYPGTQTTQGTMPPPTQHMPQQQGQNQGQQQGGGEWGMPTYDLGVGMGMNMDGWNTHGNAWIG